ncbi:MAG: PDZ domain-containing protein [Terriglobia bacterium]
MRRQRMIRWLIPLCGTALLLGTSVGVYAGGSQEPPRPPEPPRAPEPPEPQVLFLDARGVGMSGQAWLGVRLSEVTAEKAAELKLGEPTGALVEEVVEGSPAAKAGLQANDVIVGFAGERVRSVAQLRRLVQETPGGRRVQVEVSRAGQRRAFEVQLEERRPRFSRRIRVPAITVPHIEIPDYDVRIFRRPARLGISGAELTSQLAEYFGVEQGRGVLVREVLAGSPAAKAGVKAGDVIVAVDSEPVGSIGELRRALARKQEENRVTLTIVRDHREQSVTVELEEPQHYSPRRSAEGESFELDFDTEVESLEELEEQLREVEERIREQVESGTFQESLRRIEEQAREVEKQIRERFDSEEFQRPFRELERHLREWERQAEELAEDKQTI